MVSPPSASNLTSLLTDHVGQDRGTPVANGTTAPTLDTNAPVKAQVNDKAKSPNKKKSKKAKHSKDEKSAKRKRGGLVLKQSSFATPTPAAQSSAKEYSFESMFYKAGLKLKWEDKYNAYMRRIGSLFENIQLVDPLAITQCTSWVRQSLLDQKLK